MQHPELCKCSTQSYVDDTKLITSFELKANLDAIADLEDDLFKIGEWCSNNQLLLNPGKTKLMIFGSRQMRAKFQFQLCCCDSGLPVVAHASSRC